MGIALAIVFGLASFGSLLVDLEGYAAHCRIPRIIMIFIGTIVFHAVQDV